MKIALSQWQGRIAPVFDVAGNILLIEAENRHEVWRREVSLRESEPLLRAREVSGFGVEVLICGAVSVTLELALNSAGVRVIGFVCGSTADLLNAFFKGRFEGTVRAKEFVMPGCKGGGRRSRNRGRV